MANVSLSFMFALSVIFMIENGLPLAEGKCTSNHDCRGNSYRKVCCARTLDGCYSSSCVGKVCVTDGDCGGENECCKYGKCTTFGCADCYLNSDCSKNEYCCRRKYGRNVCRRNCVGETCRSILDCGDDSEYCSFDTCSYANKNCLKNSDCKHDGECCIFGQCVTTGCPTECLSNVNCLSSTYCCKRQYLNNKNVCLRSCVEETCHSSFDCGGPGEYCTRNNICWKPGRSCVSDLSCKGDSEFCISGNCVTTGCSQCSSNSFCGSSQYCCKRDNYTNVCRSSCIGEICSEDSDCGGPDETCNTNTTKYEKSEGTTLAGWVIAVIVVSAVVLVFVFGGGWSYRSCRGSSRRGVVVEERPVERTTAIIVLRETHIHASHASPVCNNPPPPYYNHGQDKINQYPPQPQHYPAHQPLQFPQHQPLPYPRS